MAEQAEEMAARNELFSAAAEEGKDDLLAELDDLEAEMVADDFVLDPVSAAPIGAPTIAQPAAAQAQAEEQKQAE